MAMRNFDMSIQQLKTYIRRYPEDQASINLYTSECQRYAEDGSDRRALSFVLEGKFALASCTSLMDRLTWTVGQPSWTGGTPSFPAAFDHSPRCSGATSPRSETPAPLQWRRWTPWRSSVPMTGRWNPTWCSRLPDAGWSCW